MVGEGRAGRSGGGWQRVGHCCRHLRGLGGDCGGPFGKGIEKPLEGLRGLHRVLLRGGGP